MTNILEAVGWRLLVFVPGLREPLALLFGLLRGQVSVATRQGSIGALCERVGQHDRAVRRYQAAVDAARSADRASEVRLLHRWQFLLERAHARRGHPRVDDPLFGIRVRREPARARWPSRPIGAYAVEVENGGVFVRGVLVGRRSGQAVVVRIDGIEVRRTVASREIAPRFSVVLRRDALATFPPRARLEVATTDGRLLGLHGRPGRVVLEAPRGDGSLTQVIASGRRVDKKGYLQRSVDEVEARQEAYLDLYREVRQVFDSELGRELFVLYGTLLGCVRAQDFIPGDDDFDAGYVSPLHSPTAVKRETQQIMLTLARAGFDLSINRLGRPFRIHPRGGAETDLHLDVRPVWFRAGEAWAHKHFRAPSTTRDFVPAGESLLRGQSVLVPREPERFLAAYYGSGWRTPDPTYTNNPADVHDDVRQVLDRAQLTLPELLSLQRRIEVEGAARSGTGRLTLVATRDLYPLAKMAE